VNSTKVTFVLSEQPYLPSDDELSRFWDQETIGITAGPYRAMGTKYSALLGEFHVSLSIQDQERVVSLPKIQDIILPDNRMNAVRRLGNLRKT
jgi:hypothetical protein